MVFFTDYPIDNYPKKEKNEFRILLIGGSGAQGWGAQNNDKMFYKLIEKKLQKEFNENFKIKIINLAMAGSTVINSAEILHVYGKRLNADMIFAYLGINDTSQIMRTRKFLHTGPVGFQPDHSYPSVLQKFVNYFPTIMLKLGYAKKIKKLLGYKNTNVPVGILRSYNYYEDKNISPTDFFYKRLNPQLSNAFKYIKRDFCGRPIIFVRQIWHEQEWANNFLEKHYKIIKKTNEGLYDYTWSFLKKDLSDYVNKKWYFLDAHNEIWNHLKSNSDIEINKDTWGKNFQNKNLEFNFLWEDGKKHTGNGLSFNVHLDNLGHYIFSDWFSKRVTTIIKKEYLDKDLDYCNFYFREKNF